MMRIFTTAILIVLYSLLNAEDYKPELPVNWQGLPEAYHTKSAENPPQIINRPDDASLKLPNGFIVEAYLSGFEVPRFMLLGPDNVILLSDMATGKVYIPLNVTLGLLHRAHVLA